MRREIPGDEDNEEYGHDTTGPGWRHDGRIKDGSASDIHHLPFQMNTKQVSSCGIQARLPRGNYDHVHIATAWEQAQSNTTTK